MQLKVKVGGGGRGRGKGVGDTEGYNSTQHMQFTVWSFLINFYPSLNFEMNIHRNHRTSSDIIEGKTK